MKCIIAGSRSVTSYTELLCALEDCGWKNQITEVVSGCAQGADKLGERWASENDIKLTKFPADWGKHGKAAGPIRNEKMAQYVAPHGCLIALWDGKSRGTKNMIECAKKHFYNNNNFQKIYISWSDHA